MTASQVHEDQAQCPANGCVCPGAVAEETDAVVDAHLLDHRSADDDHRSRWVAGGLEPLKVEGLVYHSLHRRDNDRYIFGTAPGHYCIGSHRLHRSHSHTGRDDAQDLHGVPARRFQHTADKFFGGRYDR